MIKMSCSSCTCYGQKQANTGLSSRLASNRPLSYENTRPMLYADVVPTYGGVGYSTSTRVSYNGYGSLSTAYTSGDADSPCSEDVIVRPYDACLAKVNVLLNELNKYQLETAVAEKIAGYLNTQMLYTVQGDKMTPRNCAGDDIKQVVDAIVGGKMEGVPALQPRSGSPSVNLFYNQSSMLVQASEPENVVQAKRLKEQKKTYRVNLN